MHGDLYDSINKEGYWYTTDNSLVAEFAYAAHEAGACTILPGHEPGWIYIEMWILYFWWAKYNSCLKGKPHYSDVSNQVFDEVIAEVTKGKDDPNIAALTAVYMLEELND